VAERGLRLFGLREKKYKKSLWKYHKEELLNLYLWSNIGMIRSRRISWFGHLACMREVHMNCLLENLK
jgi:hypothetical protein